MDTIIYLAQNYDHVYKVICVVLAIIVILYVVKRLKDRSSRKQRAAKLQSQCQHVAATDTIFVNIAMYRDYTECTNTLLDMFEKAYCPKRITVGICQHLRDGQDKNVLDIYRKAAKSQEQSYENQIRVLTEYAEDARGAMHARALVDKHLYRGEKYYLVIDSHSMFEKDWDLKLVQQLEKATEVAKHDKVVVTQIPEDVDMIQRTLTTLRHVKPNYFPVFDDWEPYLPFKSPVFKKQMFVHAPKRPFQSPVWCGRFAFARAKILEQKPHDEKLSYLVHMYHDVNSDYYSTIIKQQQGKTTLADWITSARLLAAGYELYVPMEPIVYHVKCNHHRFEADPQDPYHSQMQQQSLQAAENEIRLGQAASAKMGLDVVNGVVSPHLTVGVLTDKPRSDEVMSKFGSWTNYLKQSHLLNSSDVTQTREKLQEHWN